MSEGGRRFRPEVVERALAWRGRVQRLRRRRGPPEGTLPLLGSTVDGYLLEAMLGAGGYGTVYRASRGGHPCAVKLIYLPDSEEWGLRELEVLLRLRQAGGVALEGHGKWPAHSPLFLYIAMEYVDGRPLYAWARQHRPSARQVAELVLALARELEAVHRAGVVHRDVKGANILVRQSNGLPVLVDFGIGTYPGALEVTGPLLPGTPHYRSPEALLFRRQFGWAQRYPSPASDDGTCPWVSPTRWRALPRRKRLPGCPPHPRCPPLLRRSWHGKPCRRCHRKRRHGW